MSSLVMLYIKTVIEANKYRFNYGRQANTTLGDLMIELPVSDDEDKSLDMDYIHHYMSQLPYGDRIL